MCTEFQTNLSCEFKHHPQTSRGQYTQSFALFKKNFNRQPHSCTFSQESCRSQRGWAQFNYMTSQILSIKYNYCDCNTVKKNNNLPSVYASQTPLWEPPCSINAHWCVQKRKQGLNQAAVSVTLEPVQHIPPLSGWGKSRPSYVLSIGRGQEGDSGVGKWPG